MIKLKYIICKVLEFLYLAIIQLIIEYEKNNLYDTFILWYVVNIIWHGLVVNLIPNLSIIM